jgi:hypothetical protein
MWRGTRSLDAVIQTLMVLKFASFNKGVENAAWGVGLATLFKEQRFFNNKT